MNSLTRQGQAVRAVLDQVGIDRRKTELHRRQLFVAMIVCIGMLAPMAPAGALALRDHDGSSTTDTTYSDDPAYSDPAYSDPAYSQTIVGDPCDPAFHPDPASDPYCNPNAPDADSYNDPYNDPAMDQAAYCDPEYYAEWAEDPYCNPDAGSFNTSPTTTGSSARFASALTGRSSDDTPLTELDPAEAPIVGAGRMLLAIDAIAELGGFERATTPGGAALLRDIREGIPAAGFDEYRYTLELEQFITDFIPFLESLESDGVIVSDNLWNAAEGLDTVLFGELDTRLVDPADLGLLKPRPWLQGIADLLVRGGQFPLVLDPEGDESHVRELLAAFAAVNTDATTTTTATADLAAPAELALQTDLEPVSAETSEAPIWLAAAGLAGLFFASLAVFLLRPRRKRENALANSALHPVRSPSATRTAAETDTSEAEASKASVTELLDASRRMSASLDAATIASIALAEAKRIVGAEGGIVVRRTDSGLDPVGCEPPMLFNYDHIADGCLPLVIETGRSTAAIVHDEPLLVDVPMAMGAVPIVADGVITGAILVVRISAKPFNRDELDALEMLAPLVGSAFAVADTHETATELVDVEPLTGLQNRRRLDLDLASISTDDDVAYVMVDIDHFKNFNDTNGHAAGDEALRRVSALLQASVRPKDLVYRYGGEEFCMLLPGASAAEAAVVAERARAAVEAAIIPGMENQPAGVVTISVGVSDSAFGSPSDLVERADAALYASKRNGRNQVTLSSTE